jgi:hypothetical protein
MENSNKIKWKEEVLFCVPLLVGINLFLYIGDTFWGSVMFMFIVIYSVIYLYLLAQKINEQLV